MRRRGGLRGLGRAARSVDREGARRRSVVHAPGRHPDGYRHDDDAAGDAAAQEVEDSAVDSTAIRAAADLPTAFNCQAGVTPIQIPAVAATAASAGTAAVAAQLAVVVCASGLAGREALFLYFTPTPQTKLAALKDAFDRAKYVHGGPNWVAAGTIDPQMGTVGGEIYR